jgi:phage terminase large subunit
MDWTEEDGAALLFGGHSRYGLRKRLERAESAPDRRESAGDNGRKYVPRQQFLQFHSRAQRFACIVTHRRAGKTVACIHELQACALRRESVRPRFAYVSPFLKQSKAVAWDYLREAAFYPGAGGTINESELRVDYANGGQLRLYGADNPDALRGIYLDGVVMDEYADMDPRLWSEVIRPALADRKGWAVFIGTPRGRNALFDTWTRATADPKNWYALMLKASETGLIAQDELDLARRELSDEQYAQEFECSFDAAIVGAYYGKLMADAERQERIMAVPHEGSALVWTSWDLGIRDATAIWFAQTVGREVHLIDYYEASGVDLGHYVRELAARPYEYGGHIVPHDAQAKELGTGKSRLEVLQSLGLKNLCLAPQHRLEDGINAVRVFLPKCWFYRQRCARGVEALKLYRSNYDERLQILRPSPIHDWTSHPADSFRYLALTLDRTISTRNFFNRRLVYPTLGIV